MRGRGQKDKAFLRAQVGDAEHRDRPDGLLDDWVRVVDVLGGYVRDERFAFDGLAAARDDRNGSLETA